MSRLKKEIKQCMNENGSDWNCDGEMLTDYFSKKQASEAIHSLFTKKISDIIISLAENYKIENSVFINNTTGREVDVQKMINKCLE